MIKRVFTLLLLPLILVAAGCQKQDSVGFAIYLLAEDMPATQLANADIQNLSVQEDPVIGMDDIVAYDLNTHEIELTRIAYRRVQDLFTLPVRVDGMPFVVRVGAEAIYAGAFWTPASSLSYDGVIIMHPFSDEETTIGLALGYPGPDVFTGDDPRADPRILAVMEEAGKLKQVE